MTIDVDPDLLRSNLRTGDAGVLAVLAQLTGDPGVVDRFATTISFRPTRRNRPEPLTPRPPQRWPTAGDRRDRIGPTGRRHLPPTTRTCSPASRRWRWEPRWAAVRRPAARAGGFHRHSRCCRAPRKLPERLSGRHRRRRYAGCREMRRRRNRLRIVDRNDRCGTWYTAVYPGIRWTPSAYYSLSRDINGDWSILLPAGREYQSYLRSVAETRTTCASTPVRHRGGGAVVGRRPPTVADPHGGPRRRQRRELRQRRDPGRRLPEPPRWPW